MITTQIPRRATRSPAQPCVVVALQASRRGSSVARDQRHEALTDLARRLDDLDPDRELDLEIEPVAPATLMVLAPQDQALPVLTRVADIVQQLQDQGLGVSGTATVGPVVRVPVRDDSLLTGTGAEQALASLADAPEHGILLGEPVVRLLRRHADGRRALRRPFLLAADQRTRPPSPALPARWVSCRIEGWSRRDGQGTLRHQGRRFRFGAEHLPPGSDAPGPDITCLADIVGGAVRAVLLIGQAVDVTVTNVKPGRFAFGDTLIGETPRNLYLALQPGTEPAPGDTVTVTIGRNSQGPVGLLL